MRKFCNAITWKPIIGFQKYTVYRNQHIKVSENTSQVYEFAAKKYYGENFATQYLLNYPSDFKKKNIFAIRVTKLVKILCLDTD